MDQFSSHPLYRKHNLDSMMSMLWSFYAKNFLPLFLTSLVASLGIQLLTTTIDFTSIYSMTDPMEQLNAMKSWFWPILGIGAIGLVMMLVIQYYIIYKPVDSTVNIFNSVYKSLRYFFTFLVMMILFVILATIAMIAGILVFIVGIFFAIIYVYMIYVFILPLLMCEGNNPGSAIGRTFTLSHRHFGPNLGWTAVILLIIIVANLVLSSIVMLPFAGNFLKVLSNPEEAAEILGFMSNPWFIGLSSLTNAIFAPVIPIFSAIIYFNARARENEKPEPSEIAEEPQKVRIEDLYPGSQDKK